MKIQHSINQNAYTSEGFIRNLQKLVKENVIPYQYEIMNDGVEGAEKSHVIKNFENAAKTLKGEEDHDGFYGMVFQDSDAAKWLEAVAYSLVCFPDKNLEEKADKLIELIADSQDDDGYLNTYFTIKDKDKRWTNLLEGHELYCSGHMMEAACAYYEATGKDKLLKVCLENAKHIYNRFVIGKAEGYGGHPEIELALLKMYKLTNESFCLELAKHFIDVRGVDRNFFRKEAEKRNWCVWGMSPGENEYNQSHLPVREQKDAVGHSVRAVYLYTAMADLAYLSDDEELKEACSRLSESITQRHMHLTGAIGSTVHGEAFTVDYDLPPDTVYGETCASIGLMMFMSKMLEGERDGKYGDIMERAFYNTVLSGMALDGKSFFYVNPLESVPGIADRACTHRHIKTQRPKWYACACCPPNVARLISSFGKYAYGENENEIYCNLFSAGKVKFENGAQIVCKTEYPYDFAVEYKVIKGNKKLYIRIPAYSKTFRLKINGKDEYLKENKGYICIDVKDGDEIKLNLLSLPYFVYPNSKVPALSGKKAVMRGPLVYCAEGTDNEEDVLSLSYDDSGEVATVKNKNPVLSNAVILEADGFRQKDENSLYSTVKPEKIKTKITLIPYYTWCNRGESQMRVWL